MIMKSPFRTDSWTSIRVKGRVNNSILKRQSRGEITAMPKKLDKFLFWLYEPQNVCLHLKEGVGYKNMYHIS